jgi:hypothetical protein
MYTPSKDQEVATELAFVYHPPKGDQPIRYIQIRDAAKAFSTLLNSTCPPSRELSLAQTKLQECVVWGNAAIACNET